MTQSLPNLRARRVSAMNLMRRDGQQKTHSAHLLCGSNFQAVARG
jgi:hypothetical protein